ncbi:NADH-quinone oxidoreductase subunit NuoE [Candidatus Pelagibacter sp.]|uniref:NADH-quinone oxidoreductase subunit NuoE n=1 Tax=Candidatus Pelagibacter sp. TaxID=2024849 RepID=UPI003F84D7A5
MTLRRIAKEQPENFEFTSESLAEAKKIIDKYPKGKQQSAVMSLLYIAQKQHDNWIPLSAMKYIGKLLEMPYVKVYEVATFYTMYNLSPVGKHFVQVCTTTPCMIRGAYKIVEACKEKISENENEFIKEKNCSWMEVECLGACINAPMMQINENYYEDLDKEKALKILDEVISGNTPKHGSFKGRLNSEPENNRKTLMDVKNA